MNFHRIVWVTAIAALGAGKAWAATGDHCSPTAGGADLRIEIGKNALGAVATYRFDQAISCLRLIDAGPVRKLTWTLLTPGAQLVDNGDTVLLDSPRRSFKVQLRAFERDGQIDRTYSPLIRFGDGRAAAVYSKYLQGADLARKTTFRFSGFSPLAGAARVGPHSELAGEDATYLIVGRPHLEQLGKASLIVDQAMPQWLKSKLSTQLRDGAAALSNIAPLPGKVTYLLTYTEPQQAGAAWRGDRLPQLVRLAFSGAKWQVEDPASAATINRFVLHELFHTVNHRVRPGQAGDGSLSLLEGSAEAAAATLAHRSGALDDAGFTAAKDDALMRCLAVSGDTLSAKERSNSRIAPYACGEVLQYLAAAILKNDGRDMLSIWQALLRRQDGLSYGWSEYFAELNVLAGAAGQARIAMLQELVTGDLAWRDMLASLEREGILRKLDSVEQNRPAQSHFYAHLTLSHMLDSHCRGRRGYLQDGAVYAFDAPLDSCTGLPDKFRLVAVNGHRLASAGYDAYLEQARRCAAGEPLELQGEIGERRTLACTARFRPDLLYSFGSHH
jgi:hypothetical protein